MYLCDVKLGLPTFLMLSCILVFVDIKTCFRSVLINNTLKSLQTLQREARLRKERESLRRLAETRDDEEDEQEQEEFQTKHVEHQQTTPIVYSAEDILSDIEMPPPLPLLSPNLEDLNPLTVVLSPEPPSSVEALEDEIHATTTTTTSPLLSSNSSLSSGWLDRDSLGDWTTCAEVNGTSWQKWNCTAVGKESASTLWEEERRGGEDKLTATLDLTIIKDNAEEDAQSDSSSLGCSSEEGSSSDGREDMYDDREVSCGHSYIAEQVGGGISVINSLIASLES